MSRSRALGRRTRVRAALGGMAVAVSMGCVPKARPLAGAPVPASARLPRVELPPGHQRVVFRWRYEEEGFSARGDGAARIAAPDSARLDFFLDGGFGSGWAVLVGDSLRVPPGNVGERLIPPAPMLWAALGRVAITSARDTTLRTSGDTLRADIGSGAGDVWRVILRAGKLTSVEHLLRGRTVERLTRDAGAVRYTNFASRRSLAIDVQRQESAVDFPPSIWSR